MTEVLNNSLIRIISALKDDDINLDILKSNVSLFKSTPFLKWAGGKRQILHELEKYIPDNFNNYFEPFLGGGSLYFHLKNLQKIKGISFLSDYNSELINVYICIQENYNELILELEKFKKKHSKEYFYKVRAWDRNPYFKKRKSIQKAARFIYLNKTCFNGIWRTNLKGENNVPFGNHDNPKLYDLENIVSCNKSLNEKTVLYSGDYKKFLENAQSGDFIFLDPPYDPYSETSSFTTYNGSRFCKSMQEELYSIFCKLDEKGCYVMMTNNATPYILDLYKKYKKTTKFVNVKRYVNCNGEKRNEVQEIIIKNYE